MTPFVPLEARAAAVDVYSDQRVPGAVEWVATGDPLHLAWPYRARLTVAAERIARWMPVAGTVRALPVRGAA